MPPRVIVKSTDASVRARLDAEAQRVVTHFENQLADVRLLCFFDDQDWQPFKDEIGIANRGEGPLPIWPDYVRTHIFVPMSAPRLAFNEHD